MKSIVYSLIFLSCLSFNGLSQLEFAATNQGNDSLVDLFITSTTKIEIVRIEPVCNERRIRLESSWRKKKVKTCYAESALECLIIGDSLRCDLDTSKITGNTEISESDIETVFQLLYDSETVTYLNVCYSPRHGILFYDANDKQIGFVEICFECDRYLTTSDVPRFGLLSSVAFNELQKIFSKYGL